MRPSAPVEWQGERRGDKFRRALYTTWRRSNRIVDGRALDAPNAKSPPCGGRDELRRCRHGTLNVRMYLEAAQALARKIAAGGPDREAARAFA